MSLLSNVRFNFLAFVAGKAAAAMVGLLLPRLLGPEKMGVYTAAWGLAALVSVLGDLGLAAYVTRAVSRARSEAGAIFYRALAAQGLQLLLAGLALSLILRGKATALGPALVFLAFIPAALASLGNPFSATLQGLELFKVTGLVTTISSLFNALFLGAALWLRPDPALAFAALALSGVLGLSLWAMVLARLDILGPPPKTLDLRAFFKGALPFAMVSAANQLYVRVDLAILTWMLGAGALGQYGAAVKLVDLIVPLLGALAGPLYPRLSADFAEGAGLRRALRYLTALCLPIGLGGSLLAGPLMTWLFGAEFSEAGRAFRWLAWVPALIGVHGALLHALNALGKTKWIALIFLANLILNVGLNLALIPRYGFEAAAALSTLCEAVVLVAACVLLAKSGFALKLRAWLMPALPAALGMGLLLWFLPSPQGWQVPAWVASGAALYAGLLWALGFMGPEERMHLRRLLGLQA